MATEARAVESGRSWGTDYAGDASGIDANGGGHGEIALTAPDAADAHAADRPGKRPRTTTSRHHTDTPA